MTSANPTLLASNNCHRPRALAFGFCMSLLVAMNGCNQSEFELAPVTDTVTIDGRPFSAGKVMFAPAQEQSELETGKAAFGLLDEEGRFELSTYSEGDGAVVGKHWVMLYALDDRRTDADRDVPKFDRVPASETPIEILSGQDNEIALELTREQFLKQASRR